MLSQIFGCSHFLIALLLLLALAAPARAHIGSPNVIFEGNAGPYPVRVVVRPPQVVPGLAEISVRVVGPGVTRVAVLPVHWKAGKGGAPPPDVAKLVRGETNLYAATLWLMASGAYSVNVRVEGGAGAGDVMVPVNSIATVRLEMPQWYGAVLIVLASFLFIAAVRLVGAAWGEAVLEPGAPVSSRVRRRSLLAMTGSALLFSGMVVGGKAWWDAVDRDYRSNRLYRPLPVTTDVRVTNGVPVLRLRVDLGGGGQRYWTPLQADHGKLMHLFLIRDEEPDTFAHLHPVQRNSTTFETAVPPLPAGRYSVIADVTHETGFTQTLVAKADLPEPSPLLDNVPRRGGAADPFCGVPLRRPVGAPRAAGAAGTNVTNSVEAANVFDPDDSWHFGDPLPVGNPTRPNTCRLSGGFVMEWENFGPLETRREAPLRFRVLKSDGSPAPLEPYIGMAGHAAVRHADGGVFAHLHPSGTISMAAQEAFVRREEKPEKKDKTDITQRDHVVAAPTAGAAPIPAMSPAPAAEVVSFPYEFPRAGRYRLWVQVKCEGRVFTGVFDADVAERR
ncbi:hypothetical protein LBMAG56_37610 [Verrucomicrobiota bacterium]|nr:hypothetical protein LBMAG56_37610 [Verrucomicrobiota bacterium]